MHLDILISHWIWQPHYFPHFFVLGNKLTETMVKLTKSFFFFLPLLITSVVGLDIDLFNEVVAEFDSEVLAVRDFLEKIYLDSRCNATVLAECEASNYHECTSALANPTCPTSPDFIIRECGGEGCSGWKDDTKSIYRVAPGANLSDPHVIETICYSRLMDEWLIQRAQEKKAVWERLGVAPRATYFGTKEIFRMYPGIHSKKCGVYESSLRPWSVGVSSGPKNILLLFDTSSSMEGNRMALMKKAAIRLINTLTLHDRVAIVTFDNATKIIADQNKFLYEATAENKKTLIQYIESMEVGSGTNMYQGLEKAFDILDASFEQNYAVNCNSGILFFTDGRLKKVDGKGPSDVKEMVNRRLNATSASFGKPVLLFTYSVAEEMHDFLKELACSAEFGIATKIESDEKIVEALASYYQYFAIGLGTKENSGYTAWAELYTYTTGNINGTTVSAPVYDRTKSPPLLIGVVAIDITLAALILKLGFEGINDAIKQLARRSASSCPTYKISPCELDWYRFALGGPQTQCLLGNCSIGDLSQTISRSCSDSSMHPNELNANNDLAGLSYEERVCCGCEKSEPEGSGKESPKEPSPTSPPTGVRPSSSPSGTSRKEKLVDVIIYLTVSIGTLCAIRKIQIHCCNKTLQNNNEEGNGEGGNAPNQPNDAEGNNPTEQNVAKITLSFTSDSENNDSAVSSVSSDS